MVSWVAGSWAKAWLCARATSNTRTADRTIFIFIVVSKSYAHNTDDRMSLATSRAREKRSMEKDELLRLHKGACLQAVEVDTAGKSCAIELYLVIAGLLYCTNECFHDLTERVIDS